MLYLQWYVLHHQNHRKNTIFVNESQQGTRLVKGTAKVKEGKALVTVSLPQRPSKIVLDPYLHFTDRNFLDNRKTLLIDE